MRKRQEDFFAESNDYDTPFGHVYFGCAKEDFERDEDTVIILNPAGVNTILASSIEATIVYLDVPAEVSRNRALLRGDLEQEIIRRVNAETEKYSDLEDKQNYTYRIKLDGSESEADVEKLFFDAIGL